MPRRRVVSALEEVRVKYKGKVRLRTRLASGDGWWALTGKGKVIPVRDEDIYDA